MDHILGKIKGRGERYVKLLSNYSIYDIPDGVKNAVEYSVEYKLEDNEWYKVSEFSKKNFCPDLLKKPFNSTAYNIVEKDMISQLEFICSYQNQNEYYFQRIFKRQKLFKKRFLDFSGDLKVTDISEAIIIDDLPDALYIKNEDCLYFKKLEAINPIFKGIESLYRQATQEEVDKFLEEDFIEIQDGYNGNRVGKANRHRLAIAEDILSNLDQHQKDDLFQYISTYDSNLKYDGETFKVRNETDLKNLLYGIEQRYYTTPITQERRVANSIKKI